ncbi:MAG: type 4a pilus biogenesis protein PilO [Planctomycetota bacterium]
MKVGIREGILLALLLALPLSSYWLVFAPQNEGIERAESDLAEKRAMLDKLSAATQHNESIEAANLEIASAIEKIESRLPSDKEISLVVRQVSDLAVRSGLSQPGIATGEPHAATDGAAYMQQPLTLVLSGDFHGFYRFMLELEQIPRITRVPAFQLMRSRKDDGVMTAELTLMIYFQKEGQA